MALSSRRHCTQGRHTCANGQPAEAVVSYTPAATQAARNSKMAKVGRNFMKRIVRLGFVLISIAAPIFAASDWSTVGGDSGNTRYSSLAQINAQNVTKLGAAWVSDKIAPPPSSRVVPVIDNGLMILTAPPFVYAVNISTGQIAWKYRSAPGEGGLFGPPGSPAREGVAVGEGLVFVGLS